MLNILATNFFGPSGKHWPEAVFSSTVWDFTFYKLQKN